MPRAAVAVVRGLSKSYGAAKALDGVDLDVGRGEVFGLLGPNGAGKTTFVRCLMGLLAPDAGTVSLDGDAAYLAQDDTALADLTPALAVELTARLRGLARRDAKREAAEILDELGVRARGPIGRMSGGERRLAGVATALAATRDVIVLDEPTTGLDPTARRAVWAALDRRRERGATVVLVTHNVLEAETVLDRVAVFDRGRVIACDSPGRLKAAVSDEVRLDLVWRADPPLDDPTVAALAERADATGRRWSLRLQADDARDALGRLTSGAAFAALDDFTLATPSLEDVYLALGGRARDLEHL
ncbi:MAG TPA: ABC transporter ATP-binding protein [Frankiaceae bacterium]|nr:ABC transporter ATP-binding protein [Frankiaceae bacterium]